MNPSRLTRTLLSDCRGATVLEFALALPILVALSLTAFDAGQHLLLKTRLQTATWTMADAATRSETLSAPEARAIVESGVRLMAPFDASTRGAFFASGVTGLDGGTAEVAWQVRSGGLDSASRIGAPGGAAALPDGMALSPGESVVIVEGIYGFSAALPFSGGGASELTDLAAARPRVGELTELR